MSEEQPTGPQTNNKRTADRGSVIIRKQIMAVGKDETELGLITHKLPRLGSECVGYSEHVLERIEIQAVRGSWLEWLRGDDRKWLVSLYYKQSDKDFGSRHYSSLPRLCQHDWVAVEPYTIRCEKCGESERIPEGNPTPDHYFM